MIWIGFILLVIFVSCEVEPNEGDIKVAIALTELSKPTVTQRPSACL